MPPERPQFLVILDTFFEEDRLRGRTEYIEAAGEHLRVRWGMGQPPPEYEPQGGGVVFVADKSGRKRAPEEMAPIRCLPDDRYSYSEGLADADWLMLVMILPAGFTISQADRSPHGSRIFGDRLVVYWRLYPREDDPASAGIDWQLKKTSNDLGEDLQALNIVGATHSEEPEREHLVFLSYRREDSPWEAGRIDDALVARFGRERVFRDLGSLPMGRDFRPRVDAAIGKCKAMLVVIGSNWQGTDEPTGRRRIDQEEDWIRIEVESALQRHIPVVPVLLEDTPPLEKGQLPEPISELAFRDARRVRNATFAADIERIVRELQALDV